MIVSDRIITQSYSSNPEKQAQDVATALTIMHITDDTANRLLDCRKGWRAAVQYVQIAENGDETTLFHLDFISQYGEGNNCLEKKMLTMKNHPEIAHTADLSDDQLADGEVNYLGGLQVSSSFLRTNGKSIISGKRVLRIGFSGAKQYTDEIFSVRIAYAFTEMQDIVISEDDDFDFESNSFDLSCFDNNEADRIATELIEVWHS